MITFLVLGAGIGFVSGVSPGPVLTLVVSETLKAGWLRGAAVAAGPLLADGPIVVLAVFLMKQLPDPLIPAISAVGGVFLLYLAVTAGLNARRAHLDPDQRLTARGGLVTGLLARGLSPYPYLFWFLVGGPTVMRAAEADWLSPLAFVVGYYVTIVGSNVAVALALNRWMRLVSERLYRTLLFAASIILAAYGLVLLAYSRTSTRP